MATVLEIAQAVCRETGIAASPSTFYANTETLIVQLQRIANAAGRWLKDQYEYSELNREYTFTLTSGSAAYALPADFDHDLYNTHWNRSEYWRVRGPISPQKWQESKSGISTATPFQDFRIKGVGTNRFYLDPTPGSGDDGSTLVFEYQSRNWLRPRTFATAQSYSAGAYTFYDGSYYLTSTGGTTNGATPAADAGIANWSASQYLYETIAADTDVSVVNDEALIAAIKARWKKELRLDGYQEDVAEAYAKAREAYAKTATSKTLDIAGRSEPPWPNVAQTGYNNYGE